MIRWEYKSIAFETRGFLGGILDIDNFDKVANQLGEDGWELVSCLDTNYSNGSSRNVIAIFKRQLH